MVVKFTSGPFHTQMQRHSFLHETGQCSEGSTIPDARKFMYLQLYRQDWTDTFAKRGFKQAVMFRTGTPGWQDEGCFILHGITTDCTPRLNSRHSRTTKYRFRMFPSTYGSQKFLPLPCLSRGLCSSLSLRYDGLADSIYVAHVDRAVCGFRTPIC